ncbi:MAG: hypothetical protein J3R72DRAFT_432246 [Linnemannia gamsii]|nr:MAG: hypothetical protein J3R72DRAFT_432246 [Linnemannia gamsii]
MNTHHSSRRPRRRRLLSLHPFFLLFSRYVLIAFTCPYPDCPKSFSRSDNLNQHIRVHRHDREKTALAAAAASKPFTCFTPFLGPSEKASH